nr:hypothetical protein [Shewanella sp. YLB-07]
MRSAPPDTSSILPRIVPKPMIRARKPSVPATPFSIELMISPSGIPIVTPTKILDMIRAINGCNLSLTIQNIMMPIDKARIDNSATLVISEYLELYKFKLIKANGDSLSAVLSL